MSECANLARIQDFFKRGRRIGAIRFLLDEFRTLRAQGKDDDSDYAKELLARFWKLLDTALEG